MCAAENYSHSPINCRFAGMSSYSFLRAVFCDIDYYGPYTYRQNLRDCKAWGLLFTCLCTRRIHVELVTSLGLRPTSFLMAFSRFTNLRGAVVTVFSDNGLYFLCGSGTPLAASDFYRVSQFPLQAW